MSKKHPSAINQDPTVMANDGPSSGRLIDADVLYAFRDLGAIGEEAALPPSAIASELGAKEGIVIGRIMRLAGLFQSPIGHCLRGARQCYYLKPGVYVESWLKEH